jgi:hypothetical protein
MKITSRTQKQMEYGYGNEMSLRKFNPDTEYTGHQYTNGVDRLPRPAQNLTPELRRQLMIQEIDNISQGKTGFSVPATLPHDSPYFYKGKSKNSPVEDNQEIVYSPQAVNQTYVNACKSEMESIRIATQMLLEYSKWCDKYGMYSEAEKTQSMIRQSMIVN